MNIKGRSSADINCYSINDVSRAVFVSVEHLPLNGTFLYAFHQVSLVSVRKLKAITKKRETEYVK